MARDFFENFRDWLEETSEAIDAAASGGAAELKEHFAKAAAKIDRTLDDLSERFEEVLDDLDDRADHPSGGGDDGAHAESSGVGVATGGGTASAASVATAVADPIPAGGQPIKVGVNLRATANDGDVSFKMATKASTSGNNDVSVSSQVQSSSRKPDKLDVKVAVGDWIKEKGDGDTLDFLICVTGSKTAEANRELSRKDARDVDLVVNVNLKGLPLVADLRSDKVKVVDCVGQDGKEGIGYFGRADEDGRTVKLALSLAKGGGPVAILALDIQADDAGRPDIPDLFI